MSGLGVSVGIITYNRPREVLKCINSVLFQKPDELIVVDDSEKPKLKELNGVRYYTHRCKRIQSEARNEIISLANYDIIAFLDDDTIAQPGWLEAIKETYYDETIGGVGGPALLVNSNQKLVYKLKTTSRRQNCITRFGIVKEQSGRWVPPHTVEVDCFMGANMSFRKGLLVKVGGFNLNYCGNGYREETDMMVAIKRLGYKLMYNPKALVYHYAARTGGCKVGNRKNRYIWIGKNIGYFTKRWYKDRLRSTVIMYLLLGREPPAICSILYKITEEKDLAPLYAIIPYLKEIRRNKNEN